MFKYKYIGSRVAQRSYVKPSPDVNSDYSYDNLGRITQIHTYKCENTIVKFDYEYEQLTNNISLIKFDHRDEDNDPCNVFGYDDIARLVSAEYGLNDTNEIFTMDALGNRTNVKVRDTNDITYIVDELTNRYESIDGNSLEYDTAGNMTTDKDGYNYYYDYENRIIEIKKDNDIVTVAEYAYDALGRKIKKTDSINSANTRLYYYSNNWQVLEERGSSGNFKKWYAYGNYTDEVLMNSIFVTPAAIRVYVQDHLYSTAALLNYSGSVLERYEYDVYGNGIWNLEHSKKNTEYRGKID